MKQLVLLSFLLLCVFSLTINAQQDAATTQQWQEYMTPGPMHKMLEGGVGQWKAEITFWMDPSQPMKAEGTSVCEAIMDGRYFQTKYTSTMMGMPFSGLEITGYDNAKKKFFTSWIDNMGTGIMNLEGTWDEASKTLIFTGTSTQYDGKEYKIRETIKKIDEDNSFFEMYMDQGSGETKSMEIKYTRIKS